MAARAIELPAELFCKDALAKVGVAQVFFQRLLTDAATPLLPQVEN
jgi:hypothetical protein